ncbi:unnamed protein product, partial [Effrenium voratum]
ELEHEEELPDDVTWTTALLLMGFLVIGVGLLYLVHYPDEDIRRAMWGMVNTTLSIFCAATLRLLSLQVSPLPRWCCRPRPGAWGSSTIAQRSRPRLVFSLPPL